MQFEVKFAHTSILLKFSIIYGRRPTDISLLAR